MSQVPTVSVLIPTYNSKQTICRALSSVFAQTLQPIEVIVVDDGSTDGTVPLVKSFCSGLKHGFLELVRLDQNYGPGYARNAGWNMASGEFLAFLDSDDSWHRRKLEIQVGYMVKHKDITLTGHKCVRVSRNEDSPALPKNWRVERFSAWQLLMFGSFLLTPSVIMRCQVPYRFDPYKRYGQDRLLWLQIVLNGYKAARLELPLAYTYKAPYGEAGQSGNLWGLEKGELDIFLQLRQMGFLNRGQEILLKGWSLLKYMRRVVVCWKRRYVA